MNQDPAFLFYYRDFLASTNHMTTTQLGQYILCLCFQAERGTIRENHMKRICNNISEDISTVMEKFKLDSNGEYYNARLRKEQEKRKKWTDSRKNNLYKKSYDSSYVPVSSGHMVNVNDNVNVNNNVNNKNKINENINIQYKNNNIFKKPTIEEVRNYCNERKNSVNSNNFIDFYESKGWMIGKNKMKDWKAAIRNWERNQKTVNKELQLSPKEKRSTYKPWQDWEKEATQLENQIKEQRCKI